MNSVIILSTPLSFPINTTNSSEFSGIQSNTSTSIVWGNIHLKFVGYVLPFVIFAAFLENLFSLVILIILKSGIGKTTKFLFILITIADIGNLTCFYGLNYIAIHSLNVLTGGRFYLSSVLENYIVCKSVRGVAFFTMHNLNWLYVLINAERLVAVCFPHQAKRLFSIQKCTLYVFLILVIGSICSLYFGFMYTVQPNIAAICVTDTRIRFHWLFARLLFDVDALLGPNLLALALALLIFLQIRKKLTGGHSRNKAVRQLLSCLFK